MKRNKIILGVLAAVLSAVMLCGCAGGFVSVGKKYDAVYNAVDDYVIALEKDKTYLYKDGKKVSKKGYFSIEPIADRYSEYFKAKREADSESVILLKNDGTERELPGDVKDIRKGVYTTTTLNDDGVTSTVKTVGFLCDLKEDAKDGKVAFVNETAAVKADKIEHIGGGMFKVSYTEVPYSGLNSSEEKGTQVFVMDGEGNLITGKMFTYDAEITADKDDAINGLNVFAVTDKNGKTTLYGNNGKIDDNVKILDGSKNRIYSKENGSGKDFYAIDGSLNKVKLDYGIDEYLAFADGKHYVSEVNGKDGAEKRFRVREVLGSADEYWFKDIRRVYMGSYTYFVGTEGDETGYAPTSVIYNSKMQYTSRSNEIVGIANSTTNIKYNEYRNGFASIVYTTTGLDGVTSLASGTCRVENDENVFLSSDIYATITKGSVKKLWTAAMKEPVELDKEKTVMSGSVYKINGLPVLRDDVKYFDGTASSAAVIDSEFGTTVEEYTVNSVYGGNFTARLEKYDPFDKDAAAKASDRTAEVKIVTFNWQEDGADKNESYMLYRKSYSGEIFEKVKLGENIQGLRSSGGCAVIPHGKGRYIYKPVMNGDGGITMKLLGSFGNYAEATADDFGNIYILDNVGGKTAVYDENGTLLLDPKYNVEEVANGIAVVTNGDYYGVVMLGKTAKKAKLIKKIEYNSCTLLGTGDFVLGKTGSSYTLCNAKGKTLVKNGAGDFDSARRVAQSSVYTNAKLYASDKNREREVRYIVPLTDGKECMLTVSVKEKDVNYSVFGISI